MPMSLFVSTWADFFGSLSFSVQNQVLRASKTFRTSIDDLENISGYEKLEATSAPKEKGKSSKDLCYTDEARELSIV